MYRIGLSRRCASKIPRNRFTDLSLDEESSLNRFVKSEFKSRRVQSSREFEPVPEIIPEKFHDEWREADSRVKHLMIEKFENLQERQEKQDFHDVNLIGPNFFTINQRIQIFNMVRKGKMDYNVSIFRRYLLFLFIKN